VRDISHPESSEQAQDVEDILVGLGLSKDLPRIEVWNKIDLLDEDDRTATLNRAEREEDVYAISAVTGQGLDTLLTAIVTGLEGETRTETLIIGYQDGRKRAWLFEQGVIEAEDQTEDGFHLTVRWTNKQAAQFAAL
jgi:GTP-binding protein HflX